MQRTILVGLMSLNLGFLGCGGSPRTVANAGPAVDRVDGTTNRGPAEPAFDADPEEHFNWFANRYLDELPAIYTTPYYDCTHQREERLRYEPLSHEIDFSLSECSDMPHAATLLIEVKSVEDPNDDKADTYTTECKLRFVAQDGQWTVAGGQIYDPSFDSWAPISDFSWEAPFFEAARKVYGIESDAF